jgi:hypothetical protein
MIETVKHIAPHVIFLESSISYLSEEQARDFYFNQGEELPASEKGQLMNYIVNAREYEEVMAKD